MKKLRTMTAIILALCLLTSCTLLQTSPVAGNKDFTYFTNEIFCSMASSDSLTLNYTLASPKNYGIRELPEGLSSFTYKDLERDASVNENLLSSLQSFPKTSLSFEQKVLYDCLSETLEQNLDSQKYLAFTESLGATTGIQAQLPVLLAEFRIEDQDDLNQYFALIQSIPSYFQSLLDLEENKMGLSTLPCRSTLERISNQCQEFLKNNGFSMLAKVFDHKIKELNFLSDSEKNNLSQKHLTLITNALIPAYETLIQGITELIPHARENGSLSSYINGTAYYDFLLHKMTGSPLTTDEIEKEIATALDEAKDTLIQIAQKDASLFSSCQRYVTKFHSSEEILDYLNKKIAKDFPDIASNNSTEVFQKNDVSYEVKKIDAALEDYLSPAFYLTPPVDSPEHQVIYINPSKKYDASSLFNTLAHEGFPGHLYQNSYLLSKNVPLLRHLLDCGGFTEGWATYAEIYSYRYTGVSEDEIQILQNNMIVSLCLYGLSDIGIHSHGWNETELLHFLNQYGSWNEDTANSVYAAIVDEPASYLKYTVGYLEIMRLKEKMKETLGENFSDKVFHTYLLDMGPCSFQILENYMDEWWKKQ